MVAELTQEPWGAMMLPQAMVMAGIAVCVTGMAVPAICWRHLKAQERFQVKTRNTHYMPELSIAVRTGKAYHELRVSDRAVHLVREVRKFQACKVCLPEAYTVESVTKQKPRRFFCPGITAFAAGIWTGMMFSVYGVYWTGNGAAMLK